MICVRSKAWAKTTRVILNDDREGARPSHSSRAQREPIRNLPRPSQRTDSHPQTARWVALGTLLLCVSSSFSFPQSPQSKGTESEGKSNAAAPAVAPLPQLVDITDSTGIRFDHLSSPKQKYIVESMSGGVALIDYDRDGWPDIYVHERPKCGDGACREEVAKRTLPQ